MAASLHPPREASKGFDFTARDFERVRTLIHAGAGIALSASKQEMVYSRLARRLRTKGIQSFSTYLDSLEKGSDEGEWELFVNALTTNLTAFFRESHHFPLLADHVRNAAAPVSIWCSASSTGEEPYSIAMTLCETFGTMTPPAQVIATDIDTNVLAEASAGIYSMEKLNKLSPERLRKFFQRGTGLQAGYGRVRPELRKLVKFEQLNLLSEKWPVSGPFDAVFCRNVMIYFDKATQGKILSRLVPLMKPEAILFAGHSENFLYVSDAFRLRGKTVYEVGKTTLPNAGAKCSA